MSDALGLGGKSKVVADDFFVNLFKSHIQHF